MAFVVADDEGLVTDANSYVSVEDSEDILVNLGYSDLPSEQDLVLGTLYLDTYLDPASRVLNSEQQLLWPREPFTDSQGRDVEGVPFEVKRATALIAAEGLDRDLFVVEPSVTSEAFGDSRKTFAGGVKNDGRLKSILLRLSKLGYGSNSTTSVTLTRA